MVARNKIVNMSLNDEEYSLFMEAMIEYENISSNGRVSIGKFMRDIVLPMFNIENTPNVWDETDSANSKNSIPDSPQENVSPVREDTISKEFEFKL